MPSCTRQNNEKQQKNYTKKNKNIKIVSDLKLFLDAIRWSCVCLPLMPIKLRFRGHQNEFN